LGLVAGSANGWRNRPIALRHYRDHPVRRTITDGIMAAPLPPPLIFAARAGAANLVVVEEHLRIIAIITVSAYLPAQVPALLGTSLDIDP
jgi:hypothetical protein